MTVNDPPDEDGACAAGLTQCGDACVDPLVDVANCGACGVVCGAGEACSAGVCNGPPTSDPSCTAPESTAVTSFDDIDPEGAFSTADGVEAVAFSYGTVTMDTSEGALRLSGTVSDFSGGGIAFLSCVDASQFSGIAFSLVGTAGPTETIDVQMSTSQPESADCFGPSATVPIVASGQRVELRFSDFSGGEPPDPLDPTKLESIVLIFDTLSVLDGVNFDADVTLDDVEFF